MLFTKEIICVLLGGWLVASTYYRVTRKGFGRGWRDWFILLTIVGMLLAFRLMGIRNLVTPTERAYGVPFVIAGGLLTDGKWADGGVGLYMPLPFLANLAFGIAVCLLPLAVLSIFRKDQK